MPYELTVVGESRDERDLVVLGTDGMYGEDDPAREQFSPIQPDDQWELFPPEADVEVASP